MHVTRQDVIRGNSVCLFCSPWTCFRRLDFIAEFPETLLLLLVLLIILLTSTTDSFFLGKILSYGSNTLLQNSIPFCVGL